MDNLFSEECPFSLNNGDFVNYNAVFEPNLSSLSESEIRMNNEKSVIDKSESNILETVSTQSAGTSVKKRISSSTNRNSKKGLASLKVWRLNDELLNENSDERITKKFASITKPQETLSKWAQITYQRSCALEIEELLLRRIAGQCNISLSKLPYRIGD
jgi:hypothetical protein